MNNEELTELVHAGKVASVTVFGKEWKVGRLDMWVMYCLLFGSRA